MRVGRLLRSGVGVGADEGAAPPSDGSGATWHICERIQWLLQFRQEEHPFEKRKPRDTEGPSAGSIRASLDNSKLIPRFLRLEKRCHTKLLRRLLSCLPHLKSASVLATYTAFCCFRRGRKSRFGLAEHAKNPQHGVECETVAKADFT